MSKIIQGKNKAACGGANTAGGTEDRRKTNADRSDNYFITAESHGQEHPCGPVEI